MANTAKYFALLESLKFDRALATNKGNSSADQTSLPNNLLLLQKYEKMELTEQLHQLCLAYQLTTEQESSIDPGKSPTVAYIVRLQHLLRVITNNINFHSDAKEDLISVAHLKLCIQATQELSYYMFRCQLHEDFYKSPIFQEAKGKLKPNPCLLLLGIQFFEDILQIRQFHLANSMEQVQRDLLAGIMTLRVLEDSPKLDRAISYLWEKELKADFFRHILLLKATPLSKPLAEALHQQLLGKLNSPQGFASLVEALQQTPNVSSTRMAEIVAGIVARKGFSQQTQAKMIVQVWEYCLFYLQEPDKLCVGVLSLRRFYDLNERNQRQIGEIMGKHWEILISPEDVISGLILMENQELCNRILIWQHLFCSSSVACLPSKLLIPYLPMLLQLYDGLDLESPAASQLSGLITRCLDNREREKELPEILLGLFRWQVDGQIESHIWHTLHPRILILPGQDSHKVQVKVAHQDHRVAHDMGRILPGLLLSSFHHSLTCNVFLALLKFMGNQLNEDGEPDGGVVLLSQESELKDFLHSKYQLKLDLLIALNQMVAHQPLRTHLATQTKELLVILKDIMQASKRGYNDHILLIILNLLEELFEGSEEVRLSEGTKDLQEQLRALSRETRNPQILNSAQGVLSKIQESWRPTKTLQAKHFQEARAMIEKDQYHLQAYGIQLLIDLMQKRDAVTLSQGHTVIALALTTLKSKESYVFLNCVRLFVQLVHVMEAEVLDKLSDEYLSDTAPMDQRLVVGEAILKVAQELGPLCYRYKAVLLNCFMHGSRSPVDEFRMSAFANLAQLCRLLAYQVQNFFQELLDLVNCELTSGGYVPAKRAAVLVLAELLNGMENLLDYQEMLLPIYRLLRAIEAAESCDPQMRQHAANGLKTLNEKCRLLIQTSLEEKQLLRKQIKVLGIKDEAAIKRKNVHILELN
ncbi:hypothetical protein KR032_002025 [Drosophila birchii]|nr:hypothetical protein KR032_002025 [Drosophila birchii]